MSEAQTLQEFAKSKEKVRCVVCELDEEVLQQVDHALFRTEISRPVISEWLKTKGAKVSKYQLARHISHFVDTP